MLNSIYATPLHGVECYVSNSEKHTSLPLSVNVFEGKVPIAKNDTPVWSMVDEGKRYATKLNIYTQANGAHTPASDGYTQAKDAYTQANSAYTQTNSAMVLEVNCEGAGRFLLNKNDITIDWESGGTDSTHYFQTIAMAFWLELNGVPCIHANALEYKGKTIALIGPSGMGKSTLSAHLQKQGFNWLTDDMLAIHPNNTVYASWPKARMWPDSVEQVANEQSDALSKVHERFTKRELNLPVLDAYKGHTLSGIYLLNRQGAQLNNAELSVNLGAQHSGNTQSKALSPYISKVNTSIGLMSLLQNSMLGGAYTSLGLEKQRLQKLSALMANVPIQQINYQSDYSSLDPIQDLILDELRAK